MCAFREPRQRTGGENEQKEEGATARRDQRDEERVLRDPQPQAQGEDTETRGQQAGQDCAEHHLRERKHARTTGAHTTPVRHRNGHNRNHNPRTR